ncbi:autotransporter domain-containing protein [Prosthecobacter fluviatilis]|uniref:Autotransporter domain-containing protein n=1 Tax=Prosthecobacter fluviatilis TaxID=445931 RepID=A0ABW0KW46_9BACT
MLPTRRFHRLTTYLLSCLTAVLLTTPLAAQVQIDYTDGQTDATSYSTSSPNDPTTLSILSGTATQSGVISGTGLVIKAGAGTLILSGLNTYTNDTYIRAGTLQVVDGASFSQMNASLFVADQSGDVARLLISGGTIGFGFGGGDFNYIGNQAGSSGTVDVTGGTWTYGSALLVGNDGTGVLNLSGGSGGTLYGSAGAGQLNLGYNGGGSGTANVSGGTWVNGSLNIGYSGTGLLNISGGSLSNNVAYVGNQSGSSGTANVSGGTWTSGSAFTVGLYGTGVLNLTSGTVNASGTTNYIGTQTGSSGTVNVSGGTWTMLSSYLGYGGTGVVNLTDSGIITVYSGSGTLYMGTNSGSSGTLNLGTGGAAGTLNAASIFGGDGTAVVNFNHTGSLYFSPTLDGNLTVNHIGPGTTTLTAANTYTGKTSVLGGTLELGFGTVSADIISSSSALTLGGGTLSLTGTGTQTVNGLTTVAGTGSSIVIGDSNTLDLGALTSAGKGSSLNFNTAAGGANGGTVGSGVVLLSGQTAGSAINPGFTVTDSTGFGLATVNALNQIIRLTTTDLLPATGATAGTDYRIDNNDGGSSTAGSASLVVSASESARSITVDTTASSGILTLAPGAVISTDVWNFGGTGGNTYVITTDSVASGLTAATAAGMLQINNYNSSTVSINAPILDNGGSGLRVAGTGTTLLNGSATYTGETVISNGTVFINGDFTAATGSVTVENTATLSGMGTLGGNLHVQSGGVLKPGNFLGLGALSGISATFDSGSVFSLQGGGTLLTSLNLSGAATIAAGAILSLETTSDLTATSYTLITAASGLDSAHAFTLSAPLPTDFTLVYDGTTLKLVYTRPVTAYWTGKVDSNWSSLSSGTSNWATTVDGVTDTAALPGALTDVTFSATGVGSTQTNLDVDTTIKSLTIESDTGISGSGKQTLTVNNATTVNALLAINSSVNFLGKGDLTVGTAGTLAGSGKVELTPDRSIFVNGAISVGDPTALPGAQVLSVTTSGSGAIVMGADSVILVNLYTGAGLGDNTGISTAADQLNLHGILDASAGGTLVIGNQLVTPVFAGGDQWKVIELNSGGGTITGHLAVNDSALGLATGFFGTFDQTTGIYSIADRRPELTAYSSGLAMANAEGQAIISGVQTGLNDINNHLFNLRSGGGEEEEESDGSISAALDYGVVMGEGDGPEDKNPIAKKVLRSRQWEVFTTVNYGNVKLNPISTQSGVQIDSWASSVGIERHLSRGLTLGFAVTFLQSSQTYTGGLGKIDLEGPMLSAYLAYARKGFWGSLLYSFGAYDLGSQRNPGLGLPSAAGATDAYTNAIQYNTGWNFHFLPDRSLVTGPFIGIDYLHGTVDAYSETGGGLGALRFNKQTFESLVTRVGWSTSKKFHTDWADITPQFRLSYERQNLKNNGTSVSLINAPFTAAGGNQTPGQDYMVLGTGVNFQFTPDFSMLLGYQVQLFRNNMEAHFGSIRFGYKF